MTPFLNDLEWPNRRSCFRFLRFFEPNFLKVYMYETDLCPISELLVAVLIQLIAVKLGCCRLKDVDVVTIFLFIQSTQFFCHSDQRVINIVHSATTRSTVVGVIHEVGRRRFLLTAPIYRITDIFPGHFPLRHFLDTRVRRNTTRSASAALDAREPINWPINDN